MRYNDFLSVQSSESVVIIYSYEMKVFNKSNYQSKTLVWSLTLDNMMRGGIKPER
jgi:hypothetical protein